MTDPTREFEEQASTTTSDDAEARIGETQQRFHEIQQRLEGRNDELATAEAQRDEANRQLAVMENRLATERMLAEAGVVDLEVASLLLNERINLAEDISSKELARSVKQLLRDRPSLCSGATRTAPMPALTNTPRDGQLSEAVLLDRVAQRAAASGNRRDMAEYLRLRRNVTSSAST